MTTIISNGSDWDGSNPKCLSSLVRRLQSTPLDATFETYGNFIYRLTPRHCGYAKQYIGYWNIFGNFQTVSHVFNIHTNNERLVKYFKKLIAANKRRHDYGSR